MAFELNYDHLFELNTGDDVTPVYSEVAVGISNIAIGTNEGLDQTQYLDGDGLAETDVIGGQLILTFTGHRNYGDVAQDFIFSKLATFGTGRRTDFKWTEPNGDLWEGSCTIANISGPSGDANAKGEISFEIHFNGQPTFTPAP